MAESSPAFQRAREIFGLVVDLEPAERAAGLERHCGDDLELRRRVLELLVADEGAPNFLDGNAAELAAPALETLVEASMPDRPSGLGPWLIEGEIGGGGMSRVYLARRADGLYEQSVAVKVMQSQGRDLEETGRRFAAERRILASLDHPCIARILDGGVSDDGQPYLVMEYVEGQPLDAYCRERGASLERRLELFLDVCRAVQHAHQRLVVHRDLKPSNILVTDEGEVKLLDFGIAKLLDAGEGGESLETRTGLFLMTPQYAAPEQVRGETISAATDVYALGVILYELLVGERPYRLENRTPSEVERLICEREPPKPSTAATRPEAADDDAGDLASAEASPRALRGDLDLIVMKALRKDPRERYPSVAELAEDLERYRQRHPIAARPATLGYRCRRFVARHRLGVAAAALGLAAAVSFTVALVLQRAEAVRQRDLARSEATKATEVGDFLLGLFEANDPYESLGEETTARTLLERGVERADEMAAQPVVRAQMLDVMGRVYRRLGEYEKARSLLAEALAVRRRTLGTEHVDVASSLQHLGQVEVELGELEEASTRFEEALEILRARPEPSGLRIATVARDLGRSLRDRGELDAAEPLLVEAVERLQRQAEPPLELVALATAELAVLRFVQGDATTAEALQREAMALMRKAYGEDHPALARELHNVAYLLRRRGRYAEAEALYREALDIKLRAFGEEHPDTLRSLSNLAVVLGIQGKHEEAGELFRRVLAARREIYGGEHPSIASSLGNLATLAAEQGDLVRSETLRREELDMVLRLYGEEHPRVALTLGNLAMNLSAQGRFSEAERVGRRGLAIERQLYGEEHPEVAASLAGLGLFRRFQGDLEGAETLARQSLDMRRRLLPPDHPDMAKALQNLGSVLGEAGEVEEAESLLRRALEIFVGMGERTPQVASCRHDLGVVLMRKGEVREAEEQLLAALDIRQELLDPEHPDVQATLERLVELSEESGRRAEAARYRRQSSGGQGVR